ncbi:hypothetical protein BDW74DRAFT_177348 [Aspergillus multicolor]|uniref:Kelch repeat-containing protein n=1 Tax=Aspergillus multicolor TaxID=41759 RepID=UPI003CCD11B7
MTASVSVWSNITLPEYVPARIGAEAVWIPAAESGIVVLIGGVVHLESLQSAGLTEDQQAESQRLGQAFMTTVAVYDIAGDTWYLQNTTGSRPPMLAQFCSVYATAQDGSSHNIYVYGVYDGLDPRYEPSDNVWVLSVPSFEWFLLYGGSSQALSRKDLSCIRALPDQMLALGGEFVGDNTCSDVIRVFNLNEGRFQNVYDVSNWRPYQVPSVVSARIGGGPDGGATRTAPEQWTNDSLRGVFATPYSRNIATWYPEADSGSSGFPTWAGGLIGGLLGLLAIAAVLGAFWFRRRQRSKPRSQSHAEVSPSVSALQLSGPNELDTVGYQRTPEAGSRPLYEMHDRCKQSPVELPAPDIGDATAGSALLSRPAGLP